MLKYGQHGGYHGHYDRLGLVSFLRDNRTYHNQEFTWYGYDSFLFKMWVQASVAHDMVVVDRRMQEPTPCQCIYFEEQEAFSAVCVQTVCRWSDPPYGGQTPYPVEFPEEKCRREGRFLLAPPAVREQGDIGEYSEPVFQRRLMVLMDGCLYVWDYLEAEGAHEFDCLYHPFGSTRISGLRYVRSAERFDENPYGAAQFVTDCHWFEAEGVTELSFSNQIKRVNFNDRLDYVEQARLFGVFPQKGSVMIGRYPVRTDTFQEVQVRRAEQLFSDGCRKTVSFHQEGNRARFVTALEIGGAESGIRDIRCSGYDSIVVGMEDGSEKRITVRGMDDRAAKEIKVTVS